MALVSGIGGIFFRAADPDGLLQWYIDTFALDIAGGFWTQATGDMVFQPFPADTTYFRADKAMMLNFRVPDMDAMLERLHDVGVAYRENAEDDGAYGRFVHLEDPEGNPIELWQPAPDTDTGSTD